MRIGRRSIMLASPAALVGVSAQSQSETALMITVELSNDRDQTGKLFLKKADGSAIAGPFVVFGRSDNKMAASHGNAGRDPLKKYGDTPTGSYNIPRGVATGNGSYKSYSYGPNGALVLQPASGQAKQAEKNGRIGLLIHGGDLGKMGKLRATHGCLRLSNADMAALFAAIQKAGENPKFNRCDVVRLDATVGPPGDPDAGEDAGDPPPGMSELLKTGTGTVLP